MAKFKTIRRSILGVIAMGIAVLALLTITDHSRHDQILPQLSAVPDFALVDQNGKEFSLADTQGKVWVANVIFASCPGPCPLLTQKMARLQKFFSSEENFISVSLTSDPENDTTQKLFEYAQKYNADSSKWRFLTGPADNLSSLMVQGLKLGHGEKMTMHSNHFVLVDDRGYIRGFYDMTLPEPAKTLVHDIQNLLKQMRATAHLTHES